MEQVTAYSEFREKAGNAVKVLLMLYKSGSDPSLCALANLDKAVSGLTEVPVFTADVSGVRDIHPVYGISSVPSLLVFEAGHLISVVKGCQEDGFYRALVENEIFRAKAEVKNVKNVTVYTTPTCSWCNTLKTWLRKNNVPYTEVDVSRDQDAAGELVRRSGQQGVPQTDINGQLVVGFDQKKLKELLEIG